MNQTIDYDNATNYGGIYAMDLSVHQRSQLPLPRKKSKGSKVIREALPLKLRKIDTSEQPKQAGNSKSNSETQEE